MATQDNSPGLLSKVAKFVRNPNTDWADAGKEEPAQDKNPESKFALKQMIERKRHNDAVRRREFDQLRKLRQASATGKAELIQNPSDYRGSTGYSDLDERATTLKKIDEIEAQMSNQWWKGRQTNAPTLSSPTSPSASKSATKDPSLIQTTGFLVSTGNRNLFDSTQNTNLPHVPEVASTQTGEVHDLDFQPTNVMDAKVTAPGSGFDVSVSSVFSESKMMSVDMGKSLSDPELEEAAIRFANGDDAGAEAVLLEALNAAGTAVDVADGRAAALFDLYRGTGQQASFENLALECAQRFGRSAPGWFSTPEILGMQPAPAPVAAVKKTTSALHVWHCPAELDEAAVVQLRSLTQDQAQACCLNWGQLQTIVPSAAQQLAELLARWCDQSVRLCFDHIESLQLLLQAHTPAGDSSVPSYWWQLRLDLMRLLRLPDEFEQVALDFCVTYELSPPSWMPPRCELVSKSALQVQTMPVGGQVGQKAADFMLSPDISVGVDMLAPMPQSAKSLALSGDVLGDIEPLITDLQATVKGQSAGVVSCADLIRVDFSAAGSLLNWVAQVEAQGGRIEFRDVPRLVAAFFNLIGIYEHARVSVRTN
ncbi:MAG: hypothetical protein FD135_2955 [Comamonadaceae bacterium]|nr:MAG: hypothetical protein FD135_2955 [Comamonadaceae bacterium]